MNLGINPGTAAFLNVPALLEKHVTAEDAQKHEEHYQSLKSKNVFHVKGDGHCLIYSMIYCMLEYKENHYKYDAKEVISELRDEIMKNSSIYRNFLPSDVDPYSQFQLFEQNREYNQEICDIFLLALCNRFNVEAVIVQRTSAGTQEIKLIVKPNCRLDASSPRRVFYLLRTNDHYDPILSNSEYSHLDVTQVKLHSC